MSLGAQIDAVSCLLHPLSLVGVLWCHTWSHTELIRAWMLCPCLRLLDILWDIHILTRIVWPQVLWRFVFYFCEIVTFGSQTVWIIREFRFSVYY
jgi:hypothetical protein